MSFGGIAYSFPNRGMMGGSAGESPAHHLTIAAVRGGKAPRPSQPKFCSDARIRFGRQTSPGRGLVQTSLLSARFPDQQESRSHVGKLRKAVGNHDQ